MMGWDEVVDPLLPKHATVMVWRNKEMAQRAAALGHDVVLAPASHCYFDFYQDAPPSQPEAIGGYLPFDDVAQVPHGALLPDSLRSRMLGVQGNLPAVGRCHWRPRRGSRGYSVDRPRILPSASRRRRPLMRAARADLEARVSASGMSI